MAHGLYKQGCPPGAVGENETLLSACGDQRHSKECWLWEGYSAELEKHNSDQFRLWTRQKVQQWPTQNVPGSDEQVSDSQPH